MKHHQAFFASLCAGALLLTGALPCAADTTTSGTDDAPAALTYTGNGFTLTYALLNDDTAVSISACSTEAITVDIPSEIDSLPVTQIGEGAFYQCAALTEVSMGNQITEIGAGAFFSCAALTDITLSETLTTIGEQAFYGCTALCEITIPATVSEMGANIFDTCSTLTAFDIAAGNTAFSDTDGVLYTADGTTLIKFPEGSESTVCTVSEGVTAINANAFYGAVHLTEVTLPASLATLGQFAFEGCKQLSAITVSADNTAYTAQDGVLFNKDCTTLIKFPEKNSQTSYTVPDATTRLEDWSFVGAEQLTDINLNRVTELGEDVFYYCKALTRVTIPKGITALNGACFAYCSALTQVTLPDGLATLGNYCFVNCDSLKTVTLPNTVSSIGNYALGYTYDGSTGESVKRDDFTLVASVGSVGAKYADENQIPYSKTGSMIGIVLLISVAGITVAILVIALVARKRAIAAVDDTHAAEEAERKDAEEDE